MNSRHCFFYTYYAKMNNNVPGMSYNKKILYQEANMIVVDKT